MFNTADPEDILNGKITDVYFERTIRILKKKGINPLVRAEFFAKTLPDEWKWAIFAGLDEAMYLMKHLPVKVRAMTEGTVFHPYEPVMEIEGKYQDFCVYETAILGLICQASGVATKAARFKKLAGERPVISFGARRMHPILASTGRLECHFLWPWPISSMPPVRLSRPNLRPCTGAARHFPSSQNPLLSAAA